MPEQPEPKCHLHPIRGRAGEDDGPERAGLTAGEAGATTGNQDPPPYAELHALTNFSFLRGASHPEEMVERASELGYTAIAISDEASLAGIVRAHVAAREKPIRLIAGAEVRLEDLPVGLVLLAPDRAAYGRLTRLLTRGRRRGRKGECRLRLDDLEAESEGLIAIALPPDEALLPLASRDALTALLPALQSVRRLFGGQAHLGLALFDGPDDAARLERSEFLEAASGLPMLAAGGIEAHVEERRRIRDILAAVREGCRVDQLGRRIPTWGCRHLRGRTDLARLYRRRPDLLRRAAEVAARCHFALDELRYEYPDETAGRNLAELVEEGARQRWPEGTPEKVRALIAHELALIAELHYESYFLTVHDLVAFARSRGILCQGRGSAANSAICYCLGITAVDPDRFDMLFERFVSRDRREPPDIDVDFEHERREEVIQYVYERYGRDRAALAATVITYRGRSAVRDVGKALGLSLDQVERLAKALQWWNGTELDPAELRGSGFDPDDPNLQRVLQAVQEIRGFPRHLSQHTGGMVITRGRLDELAPIENAAMPDRSVIQWDKDDLDTLGLLKVDCLALGMLTAIRKCFTLIEATCGYRLELATVPAEVPAVYEMASRADTIGVFQIESRAQMAMLPRFRPRCFYDLVIEVAIVRPGPIQGGMVHPYLRRRAGLETVDYPSEALRGVLEKTLGVPIFQEQVMKLAVVAAGFTPGEADQLRRAMGAWRRAGIIEKFREKLIEGMTSRGYRQDFAAAVFEQIRGFGEYGFPESHAASFALLTYVSLWLKRFEPAAFACALLNSQPMGFYGPAQLVADARNHGVEVRPVDVQRSGFDHALETDGRPPIEPVPADPLLPPACYGAKGPALRLGLRAIKGFSAAAAEALLAARQAGPFESIEDCVRRSRLDRRQAALLAEAGAFGLLVPNRREAWWRAGARADEAPLFPTALLQEPSPGLRAPTAGERVLADYLRLGLSLEAHPMRLLRPEMEERGILAAAGVAVAPQGLEVEVAGISICRQRPATASGVMFVTLEDETGFVNCIVRLQVQERFKRELLGGCLLRMRGTIERSGAVVHVLAGFIADESGLVRGLHAVSRDFH